MLPRQRGQHAERPGSARGRPQRCPGGARRCVRTARGRPARCLQPRPRHVPQQPRQQAAAFWADGEDALNAAQEARGATTAQLAADRPDGFNPQTRLVPHHPGHHAERAGPTARTPSTLPRRRATSFARSRPTGPMPSTPSSPPPSTPWPPGCASWGAVTRPSKLSGRRAISIARSQPSGPMPLRIGSLAPFGPW